MFVSLDVIKFPKKIGKPFGDLPKNMYLCRRKLKVNMNTYKTYLEFIRYALNPKGERPKDVAKMDWDGFFQFADEQAILGMMYDGRKQMADESGMRDEDGFMDDLTLEWGFEAQQIKEQNEAINRKCVEVQKELQEAGFQCCILKGQGNSLLYPKPYRRMPGDIDVWVKCDGRCKMEDGRGKIVTWARQHKEVSGCRFHHVEYKEDEIGVELHFIPCSMNNPMYHKRLQKWFAEQADREDIWNHGVKLPDTEGMICIPTVRFNVIYQLAHMMHHFFDEGIGLRQMMDYYYVLMSDEFATPHSACREDGKKEDGRCNKEVLHRLGLWKFAGAVMYVMREVFHIEEQYMIAPVNERRGKTLMEEILKGGNFGQYSGLTDHNMAVKYFLKIKRNMRFVSQYPAEALCEPFFRTWHFFWRLRYN